MDDRSAIQPIGAWSHGLTLAIRALHAEDRPPTDTDRPPASTFPATRASNEAKRIDRERSKP